MTVIKEADNDEMPLVRILFEEYQQWLGVDLCFQGFAEELASLPGCYAPPQGGVLLAESGNRLIGCVAYRPVNEQQAELKRLYVKSECRGTGAGRLLFNAAMERVKSLKYRSIVLDTLPSMTTAQAMYRAHGFVEIPPYYENPEVGVVYFEYTFDKT